MRAPATITTLLGALADDDTYQTAVGQVLGGVELHELAANPMSRRPTEE